MKTLNLFCGKSSSLRFHMYLAENEGLFPIVYQPRPEWADEHINGSSYRIRTSITNTPDFDIVRYTQLQSYLAIDLSWVSTIQAMSSFTIRDSEAVYMSILPLKSGFMVISVTRAILCFALSTTALSRTALFYNKPYHSH